MSIPISVKHGQDTIEIQGLGPTDRVAQIHAQIEQLTGAFQRHQKLIFKGKCLAQPSVTLREALALPPPTAAEAAAVGPGGVPEAEGGGAGAFKAVKLMLLVSGQAGGSAVAPQLTKVLNGLTC